MKKFKSLKKLLKNTYFKWVKLAEIGTIIPGKGLVKKDLVSNGFPAIHYGQIYKYYRFSTNKALSYVANDTAEKLIKAKENDLLIVTTSENVKDILKAVAWLGNKVVISSDMVILRHNMNVKYLSYFFQTTLFQTKKKVLLEAPR